ncbi:hemin binding protein Hbp [Legionella busanensis]|uniref:Hemin binding protein Hbp n=1 Tax=Legionella busanensis TaxID=190655 RepID=A0A378JNJ9_9GAMM|nr:DUF4949 domain-containing protein [Legionella busanensis]STX52657.1 hemin binding protein Hbp [Legionella busanensis]
MKFLSLVLAFPLLISQSAFALTIDKPNACPTIEALSAIGVSNAEEYIKSAWITYRPSSSFGTANDWSFVVFIIEANSAAEAIAKTNSSLPSLSLVEGPVETKYKEWTCIYANNDQSLMAFAVTPPVDFGNWKSFIHKFNLKTTH